MVRLFDVQKYPAKEISRVKTFHFFPSWIIIETKPVDTALDAPSVERYVFLVLGLFIVPLYIESLQSSEKSVISWNVFQGRK